MVEVVGAGRRLAVPTDAAGGYLLRDLPAGRKARCSAQGGSDPQGTGQEGLDGKARGKQIRVGDKAPVERFRAQTGSGQAEND